MSAPLSSSREMAATWPLPAAQWRGVNPSYNNRETERDRSGHGHTQEGGRRDGMLRDRPAATLTEPTAARALYKEYRALQPFHHPRRTTPRPPRSPCHCSPYKGGWWYGPCTPYCPLSYPVPCMYEIGAREGFIPATSYTQARLGQAVVMLVRNSSPTLDASQNGSSSSAAAPPGPTLLGPAQRNGTRLRWAVPER